MDTRVLGVLGGPDVDERMFKSWASASDILVAADSGADTVLRHGLVPHAIVGDLDSISYEALSCGADIYKFDEQNTTDCDKLLRWVEGHGHRSVDLIGVEGDRLDHVLATLGSCSKSKLNIRLVLRYGLGIILGPGEHKLETRKRTRVSLIPIAGATGVTTEGLEWPLNDADLSLTGRLSISNVSTAHEVGVKIESGTLLAVYEYDGTILEA